jgi:hypothetical protein
MNKFIGTVMAASLFLAVPTATQAQSIFVGGGPTMPVGDFKDYAETGWMATAGVVIPVGDQGLWVAGEGFYGHNGHETEGDKTNPYGAMASLGYRAGDPDNIGPYIFGGAGLMVHKFSSDTDEGDSESQFGYQFGAGLDIPVSSGAGLWVEGRYMGSDDTKFFGILAGFGFDVSGGG